MYDNPDTRTYSYGSIDFGDADEVTSFNGPPGKVGVVRDVVVSATETFNSVTTEAQVLVGTAADTDAFATLNIGDLADTNSISLQEDTDLLATSAKNHGGTTQTSIPADTQVEVSFIAPTGGTPAGIADVQVVVDWF